MSFFCLLTGNTVNGGAGGTSNSDSEDDDDDDDEAAITEVRFVPSDVSSLETMNSALNDCLALHPDPEDQDDEDEGWPLAGERREIGCVRGKERVGNARGCKD